MVFCLFWCCRFFVFVLRLLLFYLNVVHLFLFGSLNLWFLFMLFVLYFHFRLMVRLDYFFLFGFMVFCPSFLNGFGW